MVIQGSKGEGKNYLNKLLGISSKDCSSCKGTGFYRYFSKSKNRETITVCKKCR